MRIIHRYVLRTCFWHVVLTGAAVLGLRTIVEVLGGIDDILESRITLGTLLYYALLNLPLFAAQLLPLIVLVGTVIACARMIKHNELVSVQAAGISLRRALLPVFLLGAVAVLLGYWNEQKLLPSIEDELGRVEDAVSGQSRSEYKELLASLAGRRTLYIARLVENIRAVQLSRVELTDAGTSTKWIAPNAVWVKNWLFLFEAHEERGTGFVSCKIFPASSSSDRFDKEGTVLELSMPPITLRAQNAEIGNAFSAMFDSEIAGDRASGLTEPIYIACGLWRHGTSGPWYLLAKTRDRLDTEEGAQARVVIIEGEEGSKLITKPPHELRRSKLRREMKSSLDLMAMAQTLPRLRQRLVVAAYAKWFFPMANLVLVLVGVPLLFQSTAKGSVWTGAGLAFLVCVAFYALFLTLLDIASQNPARIFVEMPFLPPLISLGLFGLVGVYFLARVLR